MRSVTVVLPASMCAMMPMLRTFLRSVRTSSATSGFSSHSSCSESGGAGAASRDGRARARWYAGERAPRHTDRTAGSPAVVREGLVGLGHLVGVLAALDSGTEAVARVEDLVHEALGHRLLAALARVADEPAQGERGRAVGLDLDRHLVGRATDATALDLHGRLDVVERTLERGDGVGAGLLAATLEGAVDDRLGDRLLAVEEDLVDELRDERAGVDRVDDERALRSGSLTRHQLFSFFAP